MLLFYSQPSYSTIPTYTSKLYVSDFTLMIKLLTKIKLHILKLKFTNV